MPLGYLCDFFGEIPKMTGHDGKGKMGFLCVCVCVCVCVCMFVCVFQSSIKDVQMKQFLWLIFLFKHIFVFSLTFPTRYSSKNFQ